MGYLTDELEFTGVFLPAPDSKLHFSMAAQLIEQANHYFFLVRAA